MKKVLVIVLSLSMMFCFFGCGSDTKESSDYDDTKYEYDNNAISTKSDDNATIGQKNALQTAKDYLTVMGFSYTGLIEQLEYEGYSSEEATYGADNCGADWNEQAVKVAQDYIDTMPFSRQELIEQLVYEGFTSEQAEYGVSGVGYWFLEMSCNKVSYKYQENKRFYFMEGEKDAN